MEGWEGGREGAFGVGGGRRVGAEGEEGYGVGWVLQNRGEMIGPVGSVRRRFDSAARVSAC